MTFAGQHEPTSEELVSLLKKIVTDRGYTDRHFREIVELFWKMKYRIFDPAGPRTEVTPARVNQWFASGRTDLAGENIWLVPPE